MPLARASELDRLFACPGSAYLPRAEDSTNKAAAWGTKVHHWAETGEIPVGPDGKLLTKKIITAGVRREVTWPPGGEHEVALAYNVLTRKAVRYEPPRPLPAGYDKKSHASAWKDAFDDEWVTGSLDYVGTLLGAWWVDDLKTGYDGRWEKYQYQQLFYCLAWTLWQYGEITEGRSTITHWRKYPIERPPQRYGGVIEVDKLNAFMDKLSRLREQILELRVKGAENKGEEVNSVLVLGDHCRFCPSRLSCPKFVGDTGLNQDDDKHKDSYDDRV